MLTLERRKVSPIKIKPLSVDTESQNNHVNVIDEDSSAAGLDLRSPLMLIEPSCQRKPPPTEARSPAPLIHAIELKPDLLQYSAQTPGLQPNDKHRIAQAGDTTNASIERHKTNLDHEAATIEDNQMHTAQSIPRDPSLEEVSHYRVNIRSKDTLIRPSSVSAPRRKNQKHERKGPVWQQSFFDNRKVIAKLDDPNADCKDDDLEDFNLIQIKSSSFLKRPTTVTDEKLE